MFLDRRLKEEILTSLKHFPVTAVTGPRQCGKSTLIKHVLTEYPQSIYLDLERPSDLRKLEDAEWFLSTQKDKLICIDEIQRIPELFPLIRSLVDEWNRSGCFLILGSASRDLLKQSSESLAGRINYKKLTPFLWNELKETKTIENYFTFGGFPRSVLTDNTDVSFEWRENFVTTFLERDLLMWAGFTPTTMRRLWQMLAHINGQTVNFTTLANSLGITSTTVKTYIDLLAGTYMVEIVTPYISNLGKRLVKTPKVYISDSGVTAALLGLRSFEEMTGHPSFGAIWEQIVLSNIKGCLPEAEIYFYRTTNGAEIDFVVKYRQKTYAIECKASFSPALSKGNYLAIQDINPNHSFIVTPSKDSWSHNASIDIVSLSKLITDLINA